LGQYYRAMHTAYITTPVGVFQAQFTSRGLAGLDLPTGRRVASRKTTDAPLPPVTQRWRREVERALLAVLAGRPPSKALPLDLSVGTPFQQQVWATLAAIPCGQTRTYSQIAAAIGRPTAVRAVGQACGANPIPVFIPCHRVLAAHGGLGGFSAGRKWKRLLLDCERGG
jgi:O-6-methylguanine DNA methyltransferase